MFFFLVFKYKGSDCAQLSSCMHVKAASPNSGVIISKWSSRKSSTRLLGGRREGEDRETVKLRFTLVAFGDRTTNRYMQIVLWTEGIS